MEHTMWGDIHISMASLAQRSSITWGRRAMFFCCQKSRGKCHANANRLTEAAPKLPKFELCSVLKAVLKTCCCLPWQKKIKYLWQWLKLPILNRVRHRLRHQADGAQYSRFLCSQMCCKETLYLYNIWSGGFFIHMCTLTLLEKMASVTWTLYHLEAMLKLLHYFNFLRKNALHSPLKQMTEQII